jgi:hypothetical protein
MDSEWVGRAGILAEAVSFVLIVPELLGPERLRGAEQALRNGMASAAVRRAVIAAWGVLYMGAFAAGSLALFVGVYPPGSPHPNIGWGWFMLLYGGMVVSRLSGFVCRSVVDHRLAERGAKGAALFARQGELGRASIAVLNPLAFGRIMKPSYQQWVFWAVGIPFHLLSFVGYVILPGGLLTLIHLEQHVLARGVGLRSIIVAIGVVMFFGGMTAQFVATF